MNWRFPFSFHIAMSPLEQLKVTGLSGVGLVGPLTLPIGGGARGVHALPVQPLGDKVVPSDYRSLDFDSFRL